MTMEELILVLERLGCPKEKCPAMAAQLEKRAKMDADRDGVTHEAALARLIGLMAQGWAANDGRQT
jgi:hypothetical protein